MGIQAQCLRPSLLSAVWSKIPRAWKSPSRGCYTWSSALSLRRQRRRLWLVSWISPYSHRTNHGVPRHWTNTAAAKTIWASSKCCVSTRVKMTQFMLSLCPSAQCPHSSHDQRVSASVTIRVYMPVCRGQEEEVHASGLDR